MNICRGRYGENDGFYAIIDKLKQSKYFSFLFYLNLFVISFELA